LYNTSDCTSTTAGTLNLDNLDDCVAMDGAAYVKTTPIIQLGLVILKETEINLNGLILD
jgi:hypothetical protein